MSRKWILFLAFSLPMMACEMGGQSTEQSTYVIGTRNAGTRELSGAKVHFGAIVSSAGYLMPGKGKADSGIQEPIPDRAVVEWKSKDGEEHRAEVPVKAVVPESFKDDVIWFEIDDAGKVEVKVKPKPGPRR